MNRYFSLALGATLAAMVSSNSFIPAAKAVSSDAETCTIHVADSVSRSQFDPTLPTIGVLLFDHVLMTEITAPVDVFTKPSKDGKKLFNVITIAPTIQPVATETGLRIVPDFTLSDSPKLDVIIVPSAYDMTDIIKAGRVVEFIKTQNKNSKFTMSNCAGAQLIGESGVADGKKIVTYVGGGDILREKYPNLKVQDDSKVSFVRDGKFLSSNGNLASYISALELLEEMTSPEHRAFVESHLYLEQLQNYKRRP